MHWETDFNIWPNETDKRYFSRRYFVPGFWIVQSPQAELHPLVLAQVFLWWSPHHDQTPFPCRLNTQTVTIMTLYTECMFTVKQNKMHILSVGGYDVDHMMRYTISVWVTVQGHTAHLMALPFSITQISHLACIIKLHSVSTAGAVGPFYEFHCCVERLWKWVSKTQRPRRHQIQVGGRRYSRTFM